MNIYRVSPVCPDGTKCNHDECDEIRYLGAESAIAAARVVQADNIAGEVMIFQSYEVTPMIDPVKYNKKWEDNDDTSWIEDPDCTGGEFCTDNQLLCMFYDDDLTETVYM